MDDDGCSLGAGVYLLEGLKTVEFFLRYDGCFFWVVFLDIFLFKTGHCGSALFSLFSGQQSPYMHPSAELYIPVSDVHPFLAMQITLFSLLRGIKNFEKQKKTKKKKQNDRTHVSVSKNLEKPKKKKKTKWQNPCLSIQKPRKTKKTKKKTKRQNLCPSIWHRASTFGFFGFSRQNQKKQKGRTYVPVSGMGSVLLFFLFFLVFRGKTKKNKMAEPISQYLAWGQYFWFFWFFWFFEAKPKKNKKAEPMSQYLAWGQYFWFFWFLEVKPKKQKGRTYVPVSGMGSVLLVFLFFLVSRHKTKKTQKNKKAEPMSQYLAWGHYFWFFEASAIFWYLTWVLQFCFFGFSRFLQYSAFPNKTLASFPKKVFFS